MKYGWIEVVAVVKEEWRLVELVASCFVAPVDLGRGVRER